MTRLLTQAHSDPTEPESKNSGSNSPTGVMPARCNALDYDGNERSIPNITRPCPSSLAFVTRLATYLPASGERRLQVRHALKPLPTIARRRIGG